MSELLQLTFWATFLSAAVRTAIPILCASIGEDISEKAGIINVGLEAVMLVGAFFGFAAAYLTRSLFWGFVVGMLAGMLLSLLHAFLSVYLKQDQNVAGRRTEPACYRAYQLYFPTDGQPVWDSAD